MGREERGGEAMRQMAVEGELGPCRGDLKKATGGSTEPSIPAAQKDLSEM